MEDIKAGKFPKLMKDITQRPKQLSNVQQDIYKEKHTPSSNNKCKEQILKSSQTKGYLTLQGTVLTISSHQECL